MEEAKGDGIKKVKSNGERDSEDEEGKRDGREHIEIQGVSTKFEIKERTVTTSINNVAIELLFLISQPIFDLSSSYLD